MRSQRDIILRRYIQEIERKEAMAARMMAQGSTAGGGGLQEGGAGEVADGEGEESKRSSKRASRK
jgi:hypothetical protein